MTASAAEACAAIAGPSAGALALEVWPGCGYRLARAEAAVVASPPFQRLRRLRQMGLAFHAWPNAENTRASHSLGVAYWSSLYLGALERADDAATRELLAEAAADLPGLSLGLVLRLHALLHDIDLLPLGHTLRYQSGAFAEPPGRPRLRTCVAAIGEAARAQAFFDAPDAAVRGAWLAAFEAHLTAAADILAGRSGPAGRLVEELVNSGLGADLMDFALRDSAAMTRPQARCDDLVDALRLVKTPDGAGLALRVGDAQQTTRGLAIADDLYRARFEVFAGSVYHPTKLAADAMLDFVLRRLGPDVRERGLAEPTLLAMGDDELLDVLVDAEARTEVVGPRVAAALRAGALHAEVWRTENLAAFRDRPDAATALALDPEWRTRTEAALRDTAPGLAAGDVIVAISAPTMQAKPANARISGPDGFFLLAEAGARGHPLAAAATAARYAGLWSLRVCLAPRAMAHAATVRRAAGLQLGPTP